MAEETGLVLILVVAALLLLLVYLYIASIERALKVMGFTSGEASAIVMGTLFLGWITVPLFPYHGWWIGISVGGGVIPLIICVILLKDRRVGVAEAFIGLTIVAYITYFITRAEEGVGIVADVPIAFVPAVAAGLYSLSVFWVDIRQAAPLAYVSGILGTLIGADVFHLGEILSFAAPQDGTPTLSIGGGNIFDMVYLTGIIAVFIATCVLWLRRQQIKRGFGVVVHEFQSAGFETPPPKDFTMAPLLFTSTRPKP